MTHPVVESRLVERDNVPIVVKAWLRSNLTNSFFYLQGCIDKLMDALNSQKNIVIGVAAGIGILELLGLIFSLILCCAIGSSDRYKA